MTKKIILFIFYSVITISISIISIYKPDYNWDILPYVASVYSLESNDTNTIHQNTYNIVRNSIPEKAFNNIISSNKYREEMFQCASCFYQQLPFYKIRPLYVFLIYILSKLNINVVSAPFIISSLSCLIICYILFFWIKSFNKNTLLTFIISVLLAISPFLLNSATEASPNALSGLFIFLALFTLYKKKIYLFIGIMLLSIFVRPDNLIILILISASMIFYRGDDTIKKSYLLLTIIIGVMIFFLIDRWSGNYKWTVWFNHSFNEYIISPAEYNAQFNLNLYLRSFLKWAILFKYSVIGIQILLFIIIIYLNYESIKVIRKDLELLILFTVAISIPIHYLIYPVIEDKYFIAQYLFIDVMFVKTLLEKIDSSKIKSHEKS